MSEQSRRRVGAVAVALMVVLTGASRTTSLAAASEFDEFGFESVSAEETTAVAGAHPDVTTTIVFNHKTDSEGNPVSAARVSSATVSLPPGLLGNPNVVTSCSTGQFVLGGSCPVDSQVGIVRTTVNENSHEFVEPLYRLEPPHAGAEIARFGFDALFYPVFVDVSIRTGSDYGATATVSNPTGQAALISATTVLWGVPADPSHDEQRLTPQEALLCETGTACEAPGGKRSSSLVPRPFITNPTACEEQRVGFTATSYELPGEVFEASAPLPATTGCEDLLFQPSLRIEPSSHIAGAPTGLSAVLTIPQTGSINTRATSALRKARVTLPEGMTIAAGAANGLEACSASQVRLGEEAQSECPVASKLGNATFVSPDLPETLHGAIYQRTPEAGHLFRIWLVSDEFGLHLKIPGEIEANAQSDRLTAVFDETPQLPVERIDLELRDGPDAPLKNPDACGSFSAAYELTPWSGTPAVVAETEPMRIDESCGGGFSPQLEAGVANPVAGSFSPLIANLLRSDGEDNLAAFEITLPEGELAKLKGVPLCPEAETVSGSCPASSKIGSVAASIGPGSMPLFIPQPGKAPTAVYLAGPYKGAPYSFIAVVPAQAGPFDLGTVTVRGGIYVNPNTSRVTVRTDPLPQILDGVPLIYRMVHVQVDRPEFTISPTDCSTMKMVARITSVRGAIATPSDRFQVGDCAALRFAPKLSLELSGPTTRGGNPALTAALKSRKGEANIARISVALPHSEFLAQSHIDNICTRVQFSDERCPAGSVYGHAEAWTPLLSKPLRGAVYLRSAPAHKLPALAIALRGQLAINLVGQIDSVNGGIRTTFDSVPDAPVTKFVLKMKGDDKSLLENSTNICSATHHAQIRIRGHNGRVRRMSSPLQAHCPRHHRISKEG